MGPQFLAGLVLGVAAIAIGWIGAAARSAEASANAIHVRSLGIILMAFCMGQGALAAVIGFLGAFEGSRIAVGPDVWAWALLAPAGAFAGAAILLRDGEPGGARSTIMSLSFALGAGMLGTALAGFRANVIGRGSGALPDAPFVAIALLMASVTIALGVTGAAAVRRMADVTGREAVLTVMNRQLLQTGVLEAVGVAGTAGAIALIFLR